MDYVVGSVASLISGNVTPNRPKRSKKPLTPMKHQVSPNVTPKSQLVDDKSVFLSPTMQKKKAIVKKSPKRIFQNNDLDVTNEEGESNFSSPKADKVKKHLKDELETDTSACQVLKNSKSPKNNDNAIAEDENSSKKKKNKKMSLTAPDTEALADESIENNKENNENVDNIEQSKSKKKRKRSKSVSEKEDTEVDENIVNETDSLKNVVKSDESSENKSPKKKKKSKASVEKEDCEKSENATYNNKKIENEADNNESKSSKKKRKRSKSVAEREDTENDVIERDSNSQVEKSEDSSANKSPKKKRKRSKSLGGTEQAEANQIAGDGSGSGKMEDEVEEQNKSIDKDTKHKNKKKNKKTSKKSENASEVNPNAITNKDSDSEHESDDEMHSENEEENKKTLNTDPVEESSDEEEAPNKKEASKEKKEDEVHQDTEDEIQRTIFVGNVPFSTKCKNPLIDLHVCLYIMNKNCKLSVCSSRMRTRVKGGVPDSTSLVFPLYWTVIIYLLTYLEPILLTGWTDINQTQQVPKILASLFNPYFGYLPQGFGYVNFKSKDGVELALALTEEDLTIKNRILRVKRCTQLTHKKLNKQETGKQGYVEKQGHRGRQDKTMGNRGNQFGKGKSGQENSEGAYRRIKRKNQDNSGGVPTRQDMTHTKKNRKEFVGLTAEKKKKQKFNKGQKKKKVLSEILTKK
nr:uncharacterized protein DDB_G0283697-like [Danaus plexippus plexippus]